MFRQRGHPFSKGRLILMHEVSNNNQLATKTFFDHHLHFQGHDLKRPKTETNNGLLLGERGPSPPGSGRRAWISGTATSMAPLIPLPKVPSPAASVNVTDDLLKSPLFEPTTSGSDEEGDSSDDTVYECSGLAASSGEEIVVSNPFFMHKQDLLDLMGPDPPAADRKAGSVDHLPGRD